LHVRIGGAAMTFDPDRRDLATKTTAPGGSRFDPRGRGARWWGVYIIGAIFVLFVLLWLLGTFEGTTDTATTPAPAATEEGATAPAAPAAPQ
jgi:hypothetical protein